MTRRRTVNGSPEMRTVVVGGGFWGAGWAKVVQDLAGAALVGVVDQHEPTLHDLGRRLRLVPDLCFTDLGEALARTRPDSAVIVVPPDAHVEVSLMCLDSGVDVLVEKPFAPTLAEAERVVSRAAHLGRRVMVTQSFRFKRGPRTVKRLIEAGAVGTVEIVEGRFAKSPRHGGFREQMEEPFLNDMAIHHIDFLRGVFGLEPRRVRATSYNPSWSWYRGNAASTIEVDAGTARADYHGNWVSRSPETSWDGSWHVQGPDGAIDWQLNRVVYRPVDFGRTVFYPGALDVGQGIMRVPLCPIVDEERAGTLREFIAARSEDREVECSGADNVRTLATVLAAIESTRTGTWVDIDR